MSESPVVFVFCALMCEAKPLIQHWQLKKLPPPAPFAIYANARYAVVVSGIGKVAMAGAVAYALTRLQAPPQPILLNIGIAGHQQHALGSLWRAHRVSDSSTGKRFYPQWPFAPACPSAALTTLAQPSSEYPDKELVDMEAAAFLEMAGKFSLSELSQCLKIVSDNRHSPATAITETAVIDWITTQINLIDSGIAQLNQARQTLIEADTPQLTALLQTHHFSASHSLQLKRLLTQWRVISGGKAVPSQAMDAPHAKAILAALQQAIDAQEVGL
jgi:hypothetical protein